ncbi:hypothetical protein TWF225_003804 [Orbilia oligospora]|nr:hypothetical protein TWF225_003804 [Orbilia oligospora]KAF3254274.1 hypothetical protein TWF217_007235 [Orbilia oligospora]KAF3267739.1 hypothetical protein TWF128_009238 [Orbilia oligospora]
MKAVLLFVFGALFGRGHAIGIDGCAADNCLRAIRATSRLSSASAACSAYIEQTITLPTVTVTEYYEISEIAQETVYTTQVDTLFDTYTSVIEDTATTTLPGSTSIVTVYNRALKKRQAAPTIPAFASPCSGEVRFTSACSCIGVLTPNIVTIPAPTETLSIITTTTYTTETYTMTEETISTTITDATISVTNIVATETLPGPQATNTVTVPYPELCKNPTLYILVASRNLSVPNSVNVGKLNTADCCLRCFTTPDCIAYVRNLAGVGVCTLLTTRPGAAPNPASPSCPNGVGDTIFTGTPGFFGKGPCQGIWQWN